MTVPERLTHLLELANKGPALRAALAEEVAEMLMAWPADSSTPDMRLSTQACWPRQHGSQPADTRSTYVNGLPPIPAS